MAEPTDLEILESPPPEPPPLDYVSPSWLVATGQDRHLRIMMLMTFAGISLVVLRWIGQIPVLRVPPALLGWLGGLAAVLVCGGLMTALVAIRCRVCGCQVALYFVRHAKFSRWMHELQAARACPRCGHHPAAQLPGQPE